MPFDPTHQSKPIIKRVVAPSSRSPRRSHQGRDPNETTSATLYALCRGDYSPEVLAIEQEIIEAQTKLKDGTPEWQAFIEKYGLQEADQKFALDEVGQWMLRRLDAARVIARARNLPIYSAAELRHQEWMRRTEIGTPIRKNILDHDDERI